MLPTRHSTDHADLDHRVAVLEQALRRRRTTGLSVLVLALVGGTIFHATPAFSDPGAPTACGGEHGSSLYCFASGQPALASQVNSNFEVLADLVDSNFSTLSAGVAQAAPTGTIVAYAGTSAPTGWALCNGGTIGGGTALATVLGSTTLPDLRGRFVLGVSGSYARFSTGGAATVALTAAQMPAHTHTYIDPTTGGFKGLSYDGSGTTAEYANEGADGVTGSVGNGQAHENMPPYLALNFIIKL